MRISAKSKYGISSLIYIAQNSKAKKYITLQTLSHRLGISRIYLEQVFALLKRANLVISAKGALGGYRLARATKDITVYDILLATEHSLFEKTSMEAISPDRHIERTIYLAVLERLDSSFENLLKEISLEQLVQELEKDSAAAGYMYQI
jgi:Rrf2 family protein